MEEKLQAPSGNEGKAHAHMDVGSRAMQEHIAQRLPAPVNALSFNQGCSYRGICDYRNTYKYCNVLVFGWRKDITSAGWCLGLSGLHQQTHIISKSGIIYFPHPALKAINKPIITEL